MNGNFIKIYRSFLEWEWWHDANTCRVFIYILLKANWADREWKGTLIKRGSFVSSLSKVASECDMTVDQLRTALKHLRSTKEITTTSTAKNTVFTVVNYDKYQNNTIQNPTVNTTEDTEQNPNKSKTEPKQIPSKSQQEKNIKNIKNNKYIYSAAVIPYLNQKAGTHFQENSEATERLLSGRINEGFTVDDMRKVVDIKCEEWLGTEWEKYLRPKTLFHVQYFEEYLNQKNKPRMQKPRAGNVNNFNNFNQRKYDFDELERRLLNADGPTTEGEE